MSILLSILLAIPSGLSPTAGRAAATPVPLSPAAASDEIRAVRSSIRHDAVRIDFRSETRHGSAAPTVESGTIVLADDFNEIVTGATHALDDFALCRTLFWQDGKPDFASQSCFAGPGFRQLELANRERIAAVIQAARAGPAVSTQRVWAEQELAVQAETSDPLTARAGPAETRWLSGSDVAARLSATGFRFEPGERQRIARYLARHLSLHPQIREAVLKSGRLPDRIETVVQGPTQVRRQSITFTAAHRVSVDYPLPPHLEAEMVARSRGDGIDARGVRQALLAIGGTAQPPRPSFAALLDRMAAAARDNKPMETVLAFMAISQQYGGDLQADPAMMTRFRSLAPAFGAQVATPEARSFMAASALAGGTQPSSERQSAAAYLAGARALDALPFGTFRYVTYANLVRTSSDAATWSKAARAMPPLPDCYWTHIASYPWASNAYKDLGDTWYAGVDTARAWEAWDLGRAVDPDWHRSTMQYVDGLEQHLRQSMPDNF